MARSTGAAGQNGDGHPLSNVVSSESGRAHSGPRLEADSNPQSVSHYVADEQASVGRGSKRGAGPRISLRALSRTEFLPGAALGARGVIDDPILIQVFGG